MDRLALALALLGLLSLMLLLLFSPPVVLSSPAELSALKPNQRVFIQGNVVADRSFFGGRRLTLDSGFTLHCSSCPAPSLRDKHIRATATLQRFQNRTSLEIHTLSILP